MVRYFVDIFIEFFFERNAEVINWFKSVPEVIIAFIYIVSGQGFNPGYVF